MSSRAFRLGLLLLALFLIARAAAYQRGVLPRNREFARRLWAGEHLYAGGLHLPYPPAWALAMSPLLLVPVPAARVLWAAAQVAGVFLAGGLLKRLAVRAGLDPTRHRAALVFAVIGVGRFLLRDFRGGGPSLLLLVAALLALERLSRARDLQGGALLGILTALKLTPGLLLVWVLWQGRWRAFAAACAAGAAMFAAPALLLAAEPFQTLVGEWARRVLAYLAATDLYRADALVPFTWMNQSLRAALYRLLVPYPAPPPPLYVPLLHLSPAAGAWIVRGLLVALGAAFLWRTRRPSPLGGTRFLVEGSACLGLATLLSPLAWRPHFVSLLPALYLLAHRWLSQVPRPRALTAILAIYLVLVIGTNRELWGDRLAEGVQSWYPVTWAALIVVSVLLGLPWRRGAP